MMEGEEEDSINADPRDGSALLYLRRKVSLSLTVKEMRCLPLSEKKKKTTNQTNHKTKNKTQTLWTQTVPNS